MHLNIEVLISAHLPLFHEPTSGAINVRRLRDATAMFQLLQFVARRVCLLHVPILSYISLYVIV